MEQTILRGFSQVAVLIEKQSVGFMVHTLVSHEGSNYDGRTSLATHTPLMPKSIQSLKFRTTNIVQWLYEIHGLTRVSEADDSSCQTERCSLAMPQRMV